MQELLSSGVEMGQARLAKDARQMILAAWDKLTQRQQCRGLVIPNRRQPGRPLNVKLQGNRLELAFCGVVDGFATDPDRSGSLQPKSHNRTALETVLVQFLQARPELEPVLEDYIA